MNGIEVYLDKVIEGDCLAILPGIPDRSIHLILCDLPYGTTVIAWDKVIDLERLWKEYERIILPNGSIILTSQGLFTGKLISSNPKWFKYKIVWVKSSATNFLNGKKQPLRRHEDICVFYNGKPTYNPQLQRGKITITKAGKIKRKSDSQGHIKPLPFVTKSRDRYPYDVVFFEEEQMVDSLYFKNASSEGPIFHPTQKPIGLSRYLVRTFSNKGDIVLDNACGSGSFLVAAVMEHRHFIGIEKNEKSVHQGETADYIKITNSRIAGAIKWRRDEDAKLSLF